MKRLAHSAWSMALVALLAAGCGGIATQSDAGAHDAAEHDAMPDAMVDAGPRVRDVCKYLGPDSSPVDPHYPYAYECLDQMHDPECLAAGSFLSGEFDGTMLWYYDCRTPP